MNTQDYDYYFQNKERILQWISGTQKYTMKEANEFLIV